MIRTGAPVIIGAGLAGLMTALHLAPEPVFLLSKSPLGADASSVWAQGGIAAAVGADDSPDLHADDTIAAGDGLCDRSAVERILRAAPATITDLAARGVPFDRALDGTLRLGLEAAHGRRRIVHAGGDGTGREVMRTLVAAARATPSITVLEGTEARRLILRQGAIAGVLGVGESGSVLLPTSRVVIATGGVGALFQHTTNPAGSIGQGLMLAARAGAALVDLEFVQFHPTALDSGAWPMPLVSEAVRGEGAVLIDENGARVMAGHPRLDLEPRDVVARAVWRHIQQGHRVFLDARVHPGADFQRRFPGITRLCLDAGIDPMRDPIPVRPAAHYHMGGIAVDAMGRSTVPGLWACGEAAATGLHGANRLASNSLLEAAVMARWVAESVADAPGRSAPILAPSILPPRPDPSAIRPIVSRALGLERDAKTLSAAAAALSPLARTGGAAADPASLALMMVVAALRRMESRGAHCRSDFPCRDNALARSLSLRLDDALADIPPLPLQARAERA